MLNYFFYRIYSSGKLISFGLGKPNYRAAFIGSFPLFFYTTAVFELMGYPLNKESMYYYLIVFFLIYGLFIWLFKNEGLIDKVTKKYADEPVKDKMIGYLIVLVYFVASIITFINVKTH